MSIIHIVGLGSGSIDDLPLGTHRWLVSGLPVVLRTAVHPVVDELRRRGVAFETLDFLYAQERSFATLYPRMAQEVRERSRRLGDIVYAVPGHPLLAEQSVTLLLADGGGASVQIGPGRSFFDAVTAVLRIDPVDGLLLLDGTALTDAQLQPTVPTLIAQVFSPGVASDVKLTLMEAYPEAHPLTLVTAAGVPGLERLTTAPLWQLDRLDQIDHLSTVFVPALTAATAARDVWLAIDLARQQPSQRMAGARQVADKAPRGSPVKLAQAVESALVAGDGDALLASLGDLWWQVIVHTEQAAARGEFSIRDVFARAAATASDGY